MEQSEYKDKHFHIFVSYSKHTEEILAVTYADNSDLSRDEVNKIVEGLNEKDDDVFRKVFHLDSEVSQIMFYLITKKVESDYNLRKITESVKSKIAKINNLSSNVLNLLEINLNK